MKAYTEQFQAVLTDLAGKSRAFQEVAVGLGPDCGLPAIFGTARAQSRSHHGRFLFHVIEVLYPLSVPTPVESC